MHDSSLPSGTKEWLLDDDDDGRLSDVHLRELDFRRLVC